MIPMVSFELVSFNPAFVQFAFTAEEVMICGCLPCITACSTSLAK